MQGLRTSCIYLCKYHGNFHTYARLLGFNNPPFTGYETLSGRGRGQLFSCIPPLLKTILQPPHIAIKPAVVAGEILVVGVVPAAGGGGGGCVRPLPGCRRQHCARRGRGRGPRRLRQAQTDLHRQAAPLLTESFFLPTRV